MWSTSCNVGKKASLVDTVASISEITQFSVKYATMSLHRSTNTANYTYPSKMKWLLPAVCVPLGIPPPSSCCGWGTGEQRAAGSTEGALLCSIPQEQRCFNLYPGMIHVNHEQKSSCQDGSKHSPIKLSHGGCSSTTVSLGRRCPFLNKASFTWLPRSRSKEK